MGADYCPVCGTLCGGTCAFSGIGPEPSRQGDFSAVVRDPVLAFSPGEQLAAVEAAYTRGAKDERHQLLLLVKFAQLSHESEGKGEAARALKNLREAMERLPVSKAEG